MRQQKSKKNSKFLYLNLFITILTYLDIENNTL